MGGGGVKVGTKIFYKEACMFCAFTIKIYMKAQKHARFMHFLHLVPPFTPHYIIVVKGLLNH